MTDYVAAFLIDYDTRTIALIRKGKPAWQAGCLNGIGGKIEPGEGPYEAMRREFREETGVDLPEVVFDEFATLQGSWGSVTFFRAVGRTDRLRTMESEPIETHSLDAIPWDECLPNLSWLIPLALYRHDRYESVVVTEEAQR